MPGRPNSSSMSSGRSLSVYSGYAAGVNFVIPPSLSFDNVMNNNTCPPCTEKDFLEFCRYVDFSEENLLFYLWEKNYHTRFLQRQENTSDIALAPAWTPQMQEDAIQASTVAKQAEIETTTTELFAGTDFEKTNEKGGKPFVTPRRPSAASVAPSNPWDALGRVSTNPSHKTGVSTSYNELARETFQSSGILAPFSIQPFREEVNRIVATYLCSGSMRQLNLSDKERSSALKALQYTTHPSAFIALQATVEASLRQTHKRFIRHALCNGNPTRIIFARVFGAVLVALGFAIAIILTLSSVPRGYRALAAVPWILGVATFLAGMKGMCVVLHGLHHRHLRPWQLFEDAEAGSQPNASRGDLVETGVEQGELKEKTGSRSGSEGGKESTELSFETFCKPVSFEDYPWVARYESRNLVRKVFDRERWVQEPAIRQMQDRVFFQSIGWAVAFTAPLVVMFVPLPGGHFF